ncbi:glycosyltransferase [Simplicispira psychrophila]|uniref:glycosyltransferase n=1 Tax=Simplicispira psychrophila TaxID=80882 RepID=UPI00056CE4FF|nr:glycosyltransferase [Simplicispira psychrophila]
MGVTVLHIGKFYPPHHGGMEVFLADLIAAQRAQGIDAAALVHGQPEPDDPPWLLRVPVQFHLLHAPIAIGFRAALARALEQWQPDVLHLHLPNNSVFWALTLADARAVPWVVHWHSDVVMSRIRPALRLAYRLYRPFEQAVLERATRIIATSPPYLQASEPLQQWHDKCAVVPLGLQLTPVADIAAASEPSVHHWQKGTLRLLSIGRLTYYKGFETLIVAVADLPGVELLIAGDGELRAALQALIDTQTPPGQAARVRLLGSISEADKTALLQSCDVFCLASRERTEAFGVVLLEAMEHARPCLVSALSGSGMPWLVQSAGAGQLVAVEDVPAWQAAIAQWQQPALRQPYGQAGQQALHQRFSIDACARAITTQYALAAPEANHATTAGKDVLIVIPARNEAATIGALLQHLQAAGWHDVLVINDHSSDDTGSIARAAGAQVLEPVLPMGAWGGMQAGIRYGLSRGYQAVITMDADGQHEVAELPSLLQARGQADVVIGAFPERASRLRQIAWGWFRRLAGFELRDLTSGFRLYNRDAMALLASREATLLDYQDLGALLMVRRAGLNITEVPVSMNLRAVGQSRIFNSWFSVGKYMAATTLLCMARWQVRAPRLRRAGAPAMGSHKGE